VVLLVLLEQSLGRKGGSRSSVDAQFGSPPDHAGSKGPKLVKDSNVTLPAQKPLGVRQQDWIRRKLELGRQLVIEVVDADV